MKIEDLVSYWAILAIFLVSNIPLLLLILFRAWVFAKLNASVKHEYDAKLEAVKSQLKEQSNETRALLDVSLSGIPQRNAINHKRQLEAIDQLIESFYKAYKMQSLVQTTSTLNMPEMSKRAGDEKTQILAKTFLTGAEDNYVKEDPAWIARPFVSTHAWQYYQAYKNIVTYSYLKLKIISLGVKENDLVYGRIKDLSKLALPDRSAEIDLLPEFGSGWLDILSTLETRLMEAFGLMIAGHSADTQNIESAKAINEQIKLADQFNRANTVVTLSTVSTAIDSDSGLRLNAH